MCVCVSHSKDDIFNLYLHFSLWETVKRELRGGGEEGGERERGERDKVTGKEHVCTVILFFVYGIVILGPISPITCLQGSGADVHVFREGGGEGDYEGQLKLLGGNRVTF